MRVKISMDFEAQLHIKLNFSLPPAWTLTAPIGTYFIQLPQLLGKANFETDSWTGKKMPPIESLKISWNIKTDSSARPCLSTD